MNVLIRTLWVCSDDCDQATSGTVPAQGLELVDIYLINNISCSASSEKPLVLLPRFIVRPSEDCFSSLPLIFLKLHWKISIIYRVKYIHIHREKYNEPSCTHWPAPTTLNPPPILSFIHLHPVHHLQYRSGTNPRYQIISSYIPQYMSLKHKSSLLM